MTNWLSAFSDRWELEAYWSSLSAPVGRTSYGNVPAPLEPNYQNCLILWRVLLFDN